MIYTFHDNKLHCSLSEININDYTFYRQGCLIPTNKMENILKQNSNQIIIAKLKESEKQVSHNLMREWSEQGKDKKWEKIYKELNEEDEEIFKQRPQVLFQEWGKFKFIAARSKEEEGELQQQAIENAQKTFMNNRDDIVDCESAQLDYLLKHWRQLMKKLCNQRIQQPSLSLRLS